MQELYSIGETAKIMGISVQTLRNYSNMDLLQPQYTDGNTGYRYYSFRQFHLIDRIKYLRQLGLSLAEIADVIRDGHVENICLALKRQQEHIAEELESLREKEDDVRWYYNYFNYFRDTFPDNLPYVKTIPDRYIIYVSWEKSGKTVESVETRLAKLRSSLEMENVRFYRQFGYIADFKALMEGKFVEQKYFIYLKYKPEEWKDCYMKIPGGIFLCFRGKIRTDEWDISLVRKAFGGRPVPAYVIADEYEDNLMEFHYCPYEVQIPIISPKAGPGQP